MTDATPLPFDLPSVQRKKLTVDFAGGNQSSDGGLLLLRQAERKLGVCGRLADAMPDRRDASRIRHDVFEMVMARVSAIACGHEDAIDLNRLRHDPLMKVAVGRCPITGAPLASQSTISRLENAPSKTEAARLTAALVDQAGTTVKPGKQEILDIDDTFCAAHGVGSHVVSQRDRQSSATRSPYCRVLADAWRARRDPADQPVRQLPVRDDPRTPDQDRRARDRTHRAHPHPAADELPGGGIVPNRRARPAAIRPMSRGASCPDEPPIQADQPQTRCTASCLTPIETDGSPARDRQPDVQKRSAWCMIRARTYNVGIAAADKFN
jgi:hypothetical protein